jgi:hypothetical protein
MAATELVITNDSSCGPACLYAELSIPTAPATATGTNSSQDVKEKLIGEAVWMIAVVPKVERRLEQVLTGS